MQYHSQNKQQYQGNLWAAAIAQRNILKEFTISSEPMEERETLSGFL